MPALPPRPLPAGEGAWPPPPAPPSFSAADRPLLRQLMAAAEFIPVRMSTFLQQNFFSEAAGRALILQPPRRFGYHYLRPEVFAQPERLAQEMKALLDLFTLIARLRTHRLIYLFPPGPQAQADMLFLNDGFNRPQPSSAHVVLNDKGDYTFQPDIIQDAKDQVIYRGMRLEGEVYELIHDQVLGVVYLSDEFRALMAQDARATQAGVGVTSAPVAGTTTEAPRSATAASACAPSPTSPAQATDLRRRRQRLALVGGLVVAGALGTAWWQAGSQRATPPGSQGIHVPPSPSGATGPPAALAPPAAPAGTARASAPAPTTGASPPQPSTHGGGDPHTAAQPPAARGEQVLGFDISKWNGQAGDDAVIDDTLAAFVFARASHGLSLDPSFARNWQRMGNRPSLWRGAYHFFALQDDPLQQAEHFLKVVGDAKPQDLCLSVDFEEASLPSRGTALSVAEVQSALLAHLDHLERHAGCVPILYTDVSMGNRYLADARFARYPLWIADWTSSQLSQPSLPHAWAAAGYRFWQRSASYTLSTTSRTPTDLDVFAGTRSQLQALRRRAK